MCHAHPGQDPTTRHNYEVFQAIYDEQMAKAPLSYPALIRAIGYTRDEIKIAVQGGIVLRVFRVFMQRVGAMVVSCAWATGQALAPSGASFGERHARARQRFRE